MEERLRIERVKHSTQFWKFGLIGVYPGMASFPFHQLKMDQLSAAQHQR